MSNILTHAVPVQARKCPKWCVSEHVVPADHHYGNLFVIDPILGEGYPEDAAICHPELSAAGGPAVVRLGTPWEGVKMTPTEARSLACGLLNAADVAERGTG